MTMKKLSFIQRNTQSHWVGDGFPVRTLFSYNDDPAAFSPFLMLDYGGPTRFEPTLKRRGVGAHPHRGFETVTLVYDGEVSHRDSTGAGGTIGPGGVQWMTAASGIVHEEFHSAAYARSGGPFQMVQLWVNLPARHKMAAPGYQGITAAQTPTLALPDSAGTVRLIAGEYLGTQAPAKTFTPMQVWESKVNPVQDEEISQPAYWGTVLEDVAIHHINDYGCNPFEMKESKKRLRSLQLHQKYRIDGIPASDRN